jgi:hypothetical protein
LLQEGLRTPCGRHHQASPRSHLDLARVEDRVLAGRQGHVRGCGRGRGERWRGGWVWGEAGGLRAAGSGWGAGHSRGLGWGESLRLAAAAAGCGGAQGREGWVAGARQQRHGLRKVLLCCSEGAPRTQGLLLLRHRVRRRLVGPEDRRVGLFEFPARPALDAVHLHSPPRPPRLRPEALLLRSSSRGAKVEGAQGRRAHLRRRAREIPVAAPAAGVPVLLVCTKQPRRLRGAGVLHRCVVHPGGREGPNQAGPQFCITV